MEFPTKRDPVTYTAVGSENRGSGRLKASPGTSSLMERIDQGDFDDFLMVTLITIIIIPPLGVLLHGTLLHQASIAHGTLLKD
jgi:hypothetical protein